MKQLAVMMLTIFTTCAWADEGVDISDPEQVSVLYDLQQKLDAVSTSIMGCMEAGEEHKSCMCKHKVLIVEFNTTVKDLFISYPEFKNLDLVRFKAPDGMWISQSLESIQQQAGQEPLCN